MNRKCALITGATGGLGSATARVFAREGMNIMLTGLGDKTAIEQQRSELEREYEVRVGYYDADLQRPEQIKDLVADTVKALGDVNVLINNAVSRHFGSVDEFSTADWDQDLAVNLSAPFHLIKNVLPHMKKNKWGRIINIASAITHVATTDRVSYVVTKTGLLGLTKAVATEAKAFNITCNAISPSVLMGQNARRGIEDLMKSENLPREEAMTKFLAARKRDRFIESIPEVMVFLCSENAREMTGANIPVDFGATAGIAESPYEKKGGA